jgi:RES domain-containing protein
MHPRNILAAVLPTIPAVPINGTFHRSVASASLHTGRRKPTYLYALGAGLQGARYTSKNGPPCLYVSEKSVTTLSEAAGIASSLVEARMAISQPMTTSSMEVNLHLGLLDLTDTIVLARLGTNIDEIDGPWQQQQLSGNPVTTQILAAEAYASRQFQGIRFFSNADPGNTNIMIWTETVIAPSAVSVINSSGTVKERIPPLRKKRS